MIDIKRSNGTIQPFVPYSNTVVAEEQRVIVLWPSGANVPSSLVIFIHAPFVHISVRKRNLACGDSVFDPFAREHIA